MKGKLLSAFLFLGRTIFLTAGKTIYSVEISPLYALNKEMLKKKLPNTVNRIDEQAFFI